MLEQVEKDLGKVIKQLEELESEVARKKEVSRGVKDLRRQIAAGEAESQALAATQQHLTRQQAALHDRLLRLDQQVTMPPPPPPPLPSPSFPPTISSLSVSGTPGDSCNACLESDKRGDEHEHSLSSPPPPWGLCLWCIRNCICPFQCMH